ncbi:MAG: FAD-dependent oxidoreductase [Breznakia sp.]
MNNTYDVIVIGGGPAGLSAALYMARAQFSVLVLEKDTIGGQITITSEIVNYPGIHKTSGKELSEDMRMQAESFGATFLIAEVHETDLEKGIKVIKTNKGTFQSAGVIVATGASPRMLGFRGESEFKGRGVAYCATCDGEFFTGLPVFVIGGGFAAAEEAMFLCKYASKVTMIVREPDFTCVKSIADEVKAHEKIKVIYNTEIIEAGGPSHLQYAIFKNNKTNEVWRYDEKEGKTFGIFVFAGYVPATALFKSQIALDAFGYIITNADQKTNIQGIYAAGDVCIKNLRQVVTAVSDGAIAATSLEKYLPAIITKYDLQSEKVVVHKKITPLIKNNNNQEDAFITSVMKQQLQPILDTLEKTLVLKLSLNDEPFSNEIKDFANEFASLSERIQVKIKKDDTDSIPTIAFYDEHDTYLNVKFHAVPGGHEFNSFVIAVYNAVGPKQTIDEKSLTSIAQIKNPTNIKVLVSLSCTMCPEVVMAAQRIAVENKQVETEMFDLAHFPKLKEQHNVMSVPCIIVNDTHVHFGKKNIDEVVSIIQTNH